MQDRERVCNACSRLGRRSIGDQIVGTDQKIFCLTETPYEHECGTKTLEHRPQVPRSVGRGHRTAVCQRPEQLYGFFETTNPDQAVGHRQVRDGERS